MKKIISMMMCIMLLLGCMTFAQAENGQNSSAAVDIVLLLDQSGSMWNTDPSDPDGYRLDAAEMVIALLGNNGSRVAVVPFAARVFEPKSATSPNRYADTEFHPLINPEDYIAKMRQGESLRGSGSSARVGGENGESSGGTDFAEALAYAYNLLASRGPGEENQPMIILLTDGDLEVNADARGKLIPMSKPVYKWDEDSGKYVLTEEPKTVYASGARETEKTVNMESLLEDVVARCRNLYPIYTVALVKNNDRSHIQRLSEISQDTGAESLAVYRDSDEGMSVLPQYFGNLFADRIGSSDFTEIELTPVAGEANTYAASFYIPNESIMEANLFVPLKGVMRYTLAPAQGAESGDCEVMKLSSENFVLYKMKNPGPAGKWTFTLTMAPDAKVPDTVSFNLLYNYDVALHGYVGRAGEPFSASYDANSGAERPVFRRGDELVFTGRFYDVEQARMSTDTTLYNYADDPADPGDDWCKVQATYQLVRMGRNEQVVKSGALASEDDRFSLTLDMKTVKVEQGFNELPEGEYVLRIHAEGAGLIRDVEIPFRLENTPPAEGVDRISLSREVHKKGDPASSEPSRIPHDEVPSLTDYDGDEIAISFEQTEGSDVILLSYEDGKIYSESILGEDGKLRYGTAGGLLTITEDNAEAQRTIPVTMEVTSGNNRLAERWDMRISINGKKDAQGPVLLGKQEAAAIKLELFVQNDDGTWTIDRTSEVDGAEAKVVITDAATQIAVYEAVMEMDAGKVFNDSGYMTGLKQGQWNVKITISQKNGDNRTPIKSKETSFQITNAAPVCSTYQIDRVIYHNPLPSILSFLGEPSPEEERTVDLGSCFTDADNETLTFEYGAEPNGLILTVAKDGAVWLLDAAAGANGETAFTVKAIDADGEVAGPLNVNVKVVNLVEFWAGNALMALGALAGVIFLAVIIRQIRKPKFPKGAVLGVREGNSDYNTNTYEFVPSKKPISMAAIVMADTAAKYGINANALTNIIITPVRSINGSIGVRLNKRLTNVAVTLNNKAVKKSGKPAVWAPGDQLAISSRSSADNAELNIILSPAETQIVDSMGGVNGGVAGPFTMDGSSGFGFNEDVNSFGANDTTGSFGGMAPADASFSVPAGNDGFGFASDGEENAGGFSSADDNSNPNDFSGF